jgi:hypothetical protein
VEAVDGKRAAMVRVDISERPPEPAKEEIEP